MVTRVDPSVATRSGDTALRVLFIGGTGVISAAAAQRAVAVGHRLTILNRGSETLRPAPEGTEVLKADIRDTASVRAALGNRMFDVVVDFVAFTADHVALDIDLFTGRTGQYVFISSASAYQKPPARLPILESTPLRNPFWKYSRDKIACEDLLVKTYRQDGFPVTIIRPSHTYDRTSIALTGGWTDIARLRAGKPVVVHGDGTSLWTLTHSSDFAKALVGLFGLPQARGQLHHHLRRVPAMEQDLRTLRRGRGGAGAAAGPHCLRHHRSRRAGARATASWGQVPLGGLRQQQRAWRRRRIRSIVRSSLSCTTRRPTGALRGSGRQNERR